MIMFSKQHSYWTTSEHFSTFDGGYFWSLIFGKIFIKVAAEYFGYFSNKTSF